MNFLKNFNLTAKKESSENSDYTNLMKKNDLYELLPMPFCIVEKGIIVYANDIFKNLFSKNIGSKPKDIFSNLTVTEGRHLVRYNNTNYNVNIKPMKNNEDSKVDTFIIFLNESIYKEHTKDIVEQQICVCYIILDNYEEALENVDEVKIPLILAIVDRKLNAFSASLDGIIRKYEKDRYMLIFAREHLSYLKEKNFDIQRQIKEIDMGTKMPFTISIGIGDSSNSIALLSDYARSALELALGRGGDQVVIKSDTEYEYFGENRRDSDRNNRVKARVKAHALSELLLDYDKVLIMGHIHPDLDCLGASVGIYKIVNSVNASCSCHIVLDQEVTSSISGLYESLIAHPEYKNNVFISNKKAIQFCDKDTLVIVADVYRKEITQCPKILENCSDIVVFDHHRKSSDHITGEVLVYHDSSASSTSELITEMMMYLKSNVKLLQVEAEALLSGITLDTKGFTFKTSSKTFECAAYLKKRGADSHNVHMLLQSDFETYKAKSDAVNNAYVYRDMFAFTTVSSEVENHVLVVAQTADELLNLTHITSSFVFCQIDSERVIISLRSFGDLNVQLIAEQFGGGGHRSVAACQVKNMTIDEISEKIKSLIDLQIKEES